MYLPKEFRERTTILFLLASLIVFLVLAILIEMERGSLRSFVSDELASKLLLTKSYGFGDGWITEDGPVENAQAIMSGVAAILFLVAMFRCHALGVLKRPLEYFFIVGLFGLMFFYFGEEISWGQRLLGFENPEFIEEYNYQKEFNFHNLPFIHYYKDGLLAIGIFVWGIVLPLAKPYVGFIGRLQSKFRLPLPPIRYTGFFVGAIAYRVIFKTLYENPGQEGLEFLFALGMMLVSVHAVIRPGDLFEHGQERSAARLKAGALAESGPARHTSRTLGDAAE